MTYLESRGIQTTRHATKREKSFSHSQYVCVREMYAKCALSRVLRSLLVFVCEQRDTHTHTHTHTDAVNSSERFFFFSHSLLCISVCILLHGLHLILSLSVCFI